MVRRSSYRNGGDGAIQIQNHREISDLHLIDSSLAGNVRKDGAGQADGMFGTIAGYARK